MLWYEWLIVLGALVLLMFLKVRATEGWIKWYKKKTSKEDKEDSETGEEDKARTKTNNRL
ncbi:MAG: hypothetical protein PWQ12_296 [Clostridiales bacterium]|jgi:Sec-independent protein translocase protein TatA|nr:hypothetical protein [Clostridiales bacterium]